MTAKKHSSLTAFAEQSLAVVECDSLPRAIACQDAILKQAEVRVVACAPTSPGKVVLIYAGGIAEVECTNTSVLQIGGSAIIDQVVLSHVHEAVLRGLEGGRLRRPGTALGIFELSSVCALVNGANASLKHAAVDLDDMHAASGYGGKSYFTLRGEQADVEAAVEIVIAQVGERLADAEVIAAPHAELDLSMLSRPWPIDPCRS